MNEVVGFDNLIDQCQGNQIAAGFATVELCRKLFEALPPPPQLVKDPQQLRKLVKSLKQHPQPEAARRVREFLHEQLRQKQQCQGSRERYQELSRLQQLQQQLEKMDPNDLIEQLQQMGRAAVRDAQEYAAKLDDSQLRQLLRGALAGTEQRLVECAEWIATLGMGWGNEDGNPTQVSIASKLLLA